MNGDLTGVYRDYPRVATASIPGNIAIMDRTMFDDIRRMVRELADLRFLVEDQRESIWNLEEQVEALTTSLGATRVRLQECEELGGFRQ